MCFCDLVQRVIQSLLHIEVTLVFLEFVNDRINQGVLGWIAFVRGQNRLDEISFPCLTRFLSRQPWACQLDVSQFVVFMLTEKMGIVRKTKPSRGGVENIHGGKAAKNSSLYTGSVRVLGPLLHHFSLRVIRWLASLQWFLPRRSWLSC